MKFDHSFKHFDVSQALMTYAEEKLEKAKKWEIKPSNVHVTYSLQKGQCHVEIHVAGGKGHFEAHHVARDWHEAVDHSVTKLSKQMLKFKEKVKSHHIKKAA